MKATRLFLAALFAALFSATAFAVPPTTVGEMTDAISFADVALAILAVAGALATLYITWKGAGAVLTAIKKH